MTRLVLALLLLSGLARAGSIRGITVSAQTWGAEWETPQMVEALDELKSMGADSVAIHPYAQIQADGSLTFPNGLRESHITQPLGWAKERGLSVMLIPHIAYWGSPFLWRGEIDFSESVQWNRFFNHYERWIVEMATIAERHKVEIFCIGLEYSRAERYEQRWRQIIRAVRRVYAGKITYGANWNEFEKVSFWDALDYIGVLAYFPLTKTPNPSRLELASAWEPWMRRLQTLSSRYSKQVVFTEIGYNENSRCAEEPWDFHHLGGPNAQEIQIRCIEESLGLPEKYPFLAGMFYWKWFPNLPDPAPQTFDLRLPQLRATLSKGWRGR